MIAQVYLRCDYGAIKLEVDFCCLVSLVFLFAILLQICVSSNLRWNSLFDGMIAQVYLRCDYGTIKWKVDFVAYSVSSLSFLNFVMNNPISG